MAVCLRQHCNKKRARLEELNKNLSGHGQIIAAITLDPYNETCKQNINRRQVLESENEPWREEH